MGPGKYDDIATLVRVRTDADAVIVIVLGGDLGSGFSMQCNSPEHLYLVPNLLDQVSAQIRASRDA